MKKKIFRTVFFILFGILILWTIYFLYQKSQPKKKVYKVESPIVKDISEKTIATGLVVPRKEIEIKPQGVSGIIEELFVDPGDMVKKGDKIARIKIIPDMINLNAAESRVNRSKIAYEDAKKDYMRDKELLSKEVISEEEFRKTKVRYFDALEEYNGAENNLQLIMKGVTKKSAATTNTIIRSTIEGMILDVPVKEGYSVIQSNTFNAGTTVALVADMGEMIFQGKIDETEVAKLREGMNFELTIGAFPDDHFLAELEYVAPKGVEETGAVKFEIKASLSLKKDVFIRSGYSANAEIVLQKKDKVMVINEKYVTFKGDSAFVDVMVAPQEFKKRYIETGLSDGLNIEVKSGLKKGEKIKGDEIKLGKKKPE